MIFHNVRNIKKITQEMKCKHEEECWNKYVQFYATRIKTCYVQISMIRDYRCP